MIVVILGLRGKVVCGVKIIALQPKYYEVKKAAISCKRPAYSQNSIDYDEHPRDSGAEQRWSKERSHHYLFSPLQWQAVPEILIVLRQDESPLTMNLIDNY